MTARKRLYLELLLTGPQTLRALSDVAVGKTTLAIGRTLAVLHQLIEEGLVDQCGPELFQITAAGRDELGVATPRRQQPDDNITPPRTYGNHAMTAPYRTPTWPSAAARPSADDHKSISSRGM